MKNLFTTLAILFFSIGLSAQIGISGAYSTIKTSGWDEIFKNENISDYKSGYVVGLDYWFKLKEFRVEFSPEVSYAVFDNLLDGTPIVAPTLSSEMTMLAFSFNTQVYLFDLEGDCNCPTWGKEGGFFQKGFFLMAAPGVSLSTQSSEIGNTQFTSETPDQQTTRLMVSVGVGLDIGISKAITLTAFGRYRWHQSKKWDTLESLAILSQTEGQYDDFNSALTQIQPGLKISYRWNE